MHFQMVTEFVIGMSWNMLIKVHLVNCVMSSAQNKFLPQIGNTSLYIWIYVKFYLDLSEYLSPYFLLGCADDVV